MNGRLLLVVSALALAACGAPLREIPAFLDPSNPAAPESAAQSLPGAAGDDASAASANRQPSDPSQPPSPEPPPPAAEGSDTKSSWTCPMHPQVAQPTPGHCPTCGMKLVPGQARATDAQPTPARSPAPGGGEPLMHVHPQPGGKP